MIMIVNDYNSSIGVSICVNENDGGGSDYGSVSGDDSSSGVSFDDVNSDDDNDGAGTDDDRNKVHKQYKKIVSF